MKKILSLFIAVLFIAVPCAGITAFAEGNNAEIQFCVGDSVLLINGAPVQVETPYVVGAGVTLVPVRVITEAFGAEVGWASETKTVTIDYPGSNIVLQIGNINVTVNGISSNLLAAPELSPGGYTMVPLRFISETFGASVSYDDATKKITILKGTPSESGADYHVGNPAEGFRRFTSKKLGISFLIPDDMDVDTDEITNNSYYFAKPSSDDAVSCISLAVYTKSGDAGAYAAANEDLTANKQELNESITKFDEALSRHIYTALITYRYNYLINCAYHTEMNADVFFENGNYLYNLSFCFKLPNDNADSIINTILGSVNLSEINPASFGTVYRQGRSAYSRSKSNSGNRFSLILPSIYAEKRIGDRTQFVNQTNGAAIVGRPIYKDGARTRDELKKLAEEAAANAGGLEGVSVIEPLAEDSIKGHIAYRFVMQKTDESAGTSVYEETFYILSEDPALFYEFAVVYPEIVFSQKSRKDVRDILQTVEFN